MARSYANITTSIWRDPEFRRLTSSAQRAYLMMLTQADISSCGLLPMTLNRWANNASDSDPDSLSIAITELADSLFIAIDVDTEEVLIRTFSKWDGGWGNPKRLAAIVAAILAIQSEALSQMAAYELLKLNVDKSAIPSPIDSLSIAYRGPIDSPRVVVTLRTKVPNPQPTTHTPQPEPEPEKTSSTATPSKADVLFSEFWNAYPRKVGKQAAIKALAKAVKLCDAETIVEAVKRYATDPNLPTDRTLIPHPTTWLNEGRWDDESMPPRTVTPIAVNAGRRMTPYEAGTNRYRDW